MNQASSKSRNRHRRRRRSGSSSTNPPNKSNAEPSLPEMPIEKPRRYGVVFFEAFAQAKASLSQLEQQASTVDQLNIVIQADGDMDDPELCQFGKVFAGEAWTLIHRRRQEDGWYDKTQSP